MYNILLFTINHAIILLMITRDPSPAQSSFETLLLDAYEELQFRAMPAYQEVRYARVPSKCDSSESLFTKVIYENSQLDGYITIASDTTALTLAKEGPHELWTISGPGGGMVDNRDALGYVQNVLQTSIMRPEFSYMNRIEIDDETMLRALQDTINEHAEPVERIRSYTHSILVGTPDGDVVEDEGITIGTVTASGETFHFATIDFPYRIDPPSTVARHNKAHVLSASQGQEIPITCRVEFHPGRPAEYSAYFHNPATGELQTVGIPGGEDAAAELLSNGIRDYLNSL